MEPSSISDEDIRKFHQKIFLFYKEHKRDLPWRKTTNPYNILVSEFMLQQTQVTRVIEYYKTWMEKWPIIQKLANEKYKNVLQTWMGLGYNRRALYLHNTSKVIVDDFQGNVLTAMKHYGKLPGIGLYTSKAVQIFSANADIATVDTNIRRIFINEFYLEETLPDKELFQIAERCLPIGRSREWHNALMDYGAMFLTSRKTGIKPKIQQSQFKGSNRQIRGEILRMLLNEKRTEYQLNQQLRVDSERLSEILNKMLKEKTVSKTEEYYHVPTA